MALLEINNLSIQFGGLRAVDDFNLTVEKGELYGLIGPNGAGKTTVFNLLTGEYKPTEGVILLDGQDITGKSAIEINRTGIARIQGAECAGQCQNRPPQPDTLFGGRFHTAPAVLFCGGKSDE